MSAAKQQTAIANAFEKAGYMPPEERLEAAARHIVKHERDPEKRAAALLAMLQNHTDALLALAQPVMKQRAAEYCRSVAMEMAAEGEGQRDRAEQATHLPPSPKPSPQGARAGQQAGAEEATALPPARDTSAPADGREGHLPRAEQAKRMTPSRPAGNIVPVNAHLRSKAGTQVARPIEQIVPTCKLDLGVMRDVNRLVASSILDSFMIEGRPIGNVTAGEARTWLRGAGRAHRFVEVLITGVPDDMPIRKARTHEEAAEIWDAAAKGKSYV